jgi:predicted nucleic acid-binding protein
MALILIDTCMWVPFFNRPGSAEKKEIDSLLDDDRAALIGPIVTEILRGILREPRADYVASQLRGVNCLEILWDDWTGAARIGRRLASQGNQLPLSDLVLAAVSLRIDAEIYTIDPHFDLLPQLKRFRP